MVIVCETVASPTLQKSHFFFDPLEPLASLASLASSIFSASSACCVCIWMILAQMGLLRQGRHQTKHQLKQNTNGANHISY